MRWASITRASGILTGWLVVRRLIHGQARIRLTTGQGGASGYAEEILRPDLLIVEGGRSQVVNAKRRDRETALLGE